MYKSKVEVTVESKEVMEPVVEIVRIKQVIKKAPKKFQEFRICSPSDANDIIHYYIGDEDREVFLVLVLNTKNMLVAVHRAHVGSLNASVVSIREVFKTAILNNGCSLLVGHLHPSGDPMPSPPDIEITDRLYQAGQLLGIDVLDHIITTPNKTFLSMKERGHMN